MRICLSSPTLKEFTWHPFEERVLIKDVYSNGVKNYTIYYVSKEYQRLKKKEKVDSELLKDLSMGIKDILTGKVKEI